MVNVKSIAPIRRTGVKDTLLEKADLEISFFPGTEIEVISFDIN